MPKLDVASYHRGRQLYDAGATLAELMFDAERITVESKTAHDTVNTHDEHELIEARVPSLLAGFGEGVLADIRRVAGRGGQRA